MAAPSVVQSAFNDSAFATSYDVVLPAAPTAGNTLVAFFWQRTTSSPSSWVPTSISGGSWTQDAAGAGYDATQYGGPGGQARTVAFSRVAGASESATITIDPGVVTTACMIVEVAGAVAKAVTTDSLTLVADQVHSMSATVAAPSLMLVAWGMQRTEYAPADTVAPGTGVTELRDAYPPSNQSPHCWVGWKTTTSVGTLAVAGAPAANPNLDKWGVFSIAYTFEGTSAPGTAYGLDVYKVNPPGDSISYIASLDGAFNKAIRPVHNGTGSGQFSISSLDPNATPEILAQGNLVKVTIPEIDAGPIFAFFIEAGDFALISSDEEGGEILTFQGRGALAYWDWARWLAVSYVIPWWDAGWSGLVAGKPPAGSLGHVSIAAGDVWSYTITGGKIVSRSKFTTGGMSAWYDSRHVWTWAAGTTYAGNKQTLVKLSSGVHDNEWIHPTDARITDVKASSVLGMRPEFGDIGEADVVQWWDSGWGSPPGGTLGRVSVAAGTYRTYTVSGGRVTGTGSFTTGGLSAWYDHRQKVKRSGSLSPITLVQLSSGVHDNEWIRPSQTGVRDWQAKDPTGTFTPGKVLWRIFDEVQNADRPSHPVPLMTIDFDDIVDSDGNDWNTTPALVGITADVGDSYLDSVAKLIATGLVDVQMSPDLLMQAWNEQGRDLTGAAFGTGVVRFERAVNIADELRREVSGGGPVATFSQVVGEDSTYAYATLTDAADRVTREITTRADTSDADGLVAAGLEDLEAQLVRSDAVGFATVVGDDAATGLYLPGPPGSAHGAYWLGDLVILHTGMGEQDFNEAAVRVAAITIAEDETGAVTATPELASTLGAAESALASSTGSGGADGSGGSTSSSMPSTVDLSAYQVISEKGVVDGYASLDGAGLVPLAELPPVELAIEGGQSVIMAHGSMGSTETFDPTDGNVHTGTLTAACTFTLNAPAGSGSCTLELVLDQDGTGGWAITWPGSVTVVGTLDTTASTQSRVILETLDGGTSWVAYVVGAGAGASALDDLTDVTITTPASADRLRYNGSVWVNSPAMWVPVMVEDGATGLWYVVVTGDGDATMTEVS